MTAPSVTEGVPRGLTAGQVVRALNLKGETIKGTLTSGALPSWQSRS